MVIDMVETKSTPNPYTLQFLPGKKVSEVGPIEFLKNDKSVPSLDPKSTTKSSCFKLYFDMRELLIPFKYSTSSFVTPVLYG